MDFIKKHKLTTFIIVIYIVVVGFGYFIYNMFIGSNGMPVYGDRLYGIENVPITETQYQSIMDELHKEDAVVSIVKPYLSGKILKVIITVTDTLGFDVTKALANKVTSQLTKEQNAFYDVEVFITKEYHCTLLATGITDEEGNFLSDVVVKFKSDLSKNNNALDYGITNTDKLEYNKIQEYKVTTVGEHIIYGFTKDKGGESKCSVKVIRKQGNVENQTEETVSSAKTRSFPIIGYKRKNTEKFVWTKDR